MRTGRMLGAILATLITGALLAGCGSGSGDGDELVVYSGRNENLVRPILDRFSKDTGVKIRVRYGDTAELAATLLEEGSNTRADVFFSQDAGALAALADKGRLASLAPASISDVDQRFRDPSGRWVGVTGRARVISYNTNQVQTAALPESVLELTDPKWKDKIGFPPTNASFVAFVSALTEKLGKDRTRAWLQGLKANGAKTYDNNLLTLEAVADGEVLLGLVNHYYLHAEFKQRPGSPVANHYPGQGPGGEGTFVNVSGVGILEGTNQKADAQRLVDYLLGVDGQQYFKDETAEYPLRNGVAPPADLTPISQLRTIDVPLTELGADLQESVSLLKEVGFT